MGKHLTNNAAEIVILQRNLKDLQGQLANAQKRILELIQDKDSATEELIKERQLLVELSKNVNHYESEASDKIQKQIDDWPDVLDSKPKNFKMPPQPGYRVKEGEKWVKIGADGEMEFEDIEIKK
jgi:predicted transcriptional regulator